MRGITLLPVNPIQILQWWRCSHCLLGQRLGSLANPSVNVQGLHVAGGGCTPAEQIAGNTENEIWTGVSKCLPAHINWYLPLDRSDHWQQEDRQGNFIRTGRTAKGRSQGGGWVSQGWPWAYIVCWRSKALEETAAGPGFGATIGTVVRIPDCAKRTGCHMLPLLTADSFT